MERLIRHRFLGGGEDGSAPPFLGFARRFLVSGGDPNTEANPSNLPFPMKKRHNGHSVRVSPPIKLAV